MAINDELRYEMNENGERVIVKSIESTLRAYLRFSNLTERPVDIWWRDFQGIKRHYVRLKANAGYVVNSFITHPWEFTDAATKERYCIKNKYIFRPPPSIGGMTYRTNWNITIPVRSLRATAALAIATRVSRPEFVSELELPRDLGSEVRELVRLFSEEEVVE